MIDTTAPTPLTAAGSRRSGRAADPSPRIRRPAAVGLARIAAGVAGLTRHAGTAVPGLAAERIWPGLLATLAGQLRATILVVGTNGKTTTAGLITEMLRRAEGPPIANRSGANMRQGIATSLVRASDLRGRLQSGKLGRQTGVFEVDEAALAQILPDLGPSVIVATNLFRDQLDRYGEADAVVDRWAAALATAAAGSVLVYCADDPRLAILASDSMLPSRSFGLDGPPTDRRQRLTDDDVIADPISCPACGRQLTYAWRSIGHLGAFSCPDGHLGRRTPDLMIGPVPGDEPPDRSGVRVTTTTLRVSGGLGGALARRAPIGLPNAYNLAAAITATTTLGCLVDDSAHAIEGYPGSFGRLEWMEIEGRHVVMCLVKNTVSLAEMVQLGPSLAPDVVLLGLNDAPADGRDVSWIWDAPLAALLADRVVVLTGSRSADLELRVKYDRDRSSLPPGSVRSISSLPAALDAAVARAPHGGIVLIAATYTAMMGLRAVARRRGDVPATPS
jgi:UDP-N-acetylmuramyl tripeptide synthase